MTCTRPIKMSRSSEINPATGKRPLVSNTSKALIEGHSLLVPCGQCMDCRLDKADVWATRLAHEAQMHESSSFITLTYDDDHVPRSYSVDLAHWQRFMKRLRSKIGLKVRFCACGEYGEENLRPHYHALIFGYAFPDRTPWAERNGYPVWKSAELEQLWPLGMSEIGTVGPDSAGYIARYTTKKITGAKADDHYFRVSPVDGQAHHISPEFLVMSRRPGIGSTWFDTFAGDCFPSDFLIVNGRRKPVPGFYLNKLAERSSTPRVDHPRPGHYLRDLASGEVTRIKRKRAAKAAAPAVKANNTPERLAVRGEVRRLNARHLKRVL